jgi:excisionase family DNA binding protein
MKRTDQNPSVRTWMTVADAAEYAAVSRETIYNACLSGELEHSRIGGRRNIRVRPAWVDCWLEKHSRRVGPVSLFRDFQG